jgi:alpha-ketoglutarate-dependent taurine dioxygenase
VNSVTLQELAIETEAQWPIRFQAEGRGSQLLAWAEENRARVDEVLNSQGAVFLPALKINGSEQFERFATALFGSPLEQYRNPSTPRTQLKGNVYTSTEYPAEETIPLHNENSYTREWVMRIAFFSQLPATRGGETPIADSRRVYDRIPEEVRDRFERLGVQYVRNYGSVDLSWQQVFQTQEREGVERYCAARGIEYEWLPSGNLRTREVCQAVARHPVSGEKVWFNQAHLFHVSNYRPDVRRSLLDTFGEENLPRNAYYGDGSALRDEDLAVVRAAFAREKVSFPWGLGDLLVLDNMLCAHGREPFSGPRRVLVGMAKPFQGKQG